MWAVHFVNLSIRGDTESIGYNFTSGKGPATTTLLLVADGVDTVWPLGAGVEAGWEGLDIFLCIVKESIWLSNGAVVQDGSGVDLKLLNGLS